MILLKGQKLFGIYKNNIGIKCQLHYYFHYEDHFSVH
jgi:hypothetical protein